MEGSGETPQGEAFQHTPPEREAVLALAREALESAVGGRGLPPRPPVVETCPALERPSGCFVTLYGPGGRLRGCIGFIEAVKPLWEVVQQAAVGAALRDTRFAPVSERELPDIRLDVSLLSPAEPMEPEQVVPGRHGLIVEADGRRGLLLPQVASERGWDRETFLSQTCVKAGLPPDRWKRPGLLLSAFTAEVFGEPGAGQ